MNNIDVAEEENKDAQNTISYASRDPMDGTKNVKL